MAACVCVCVLQVITHFLPLEEVLDECVGQEVVLTIERGGVPVSRWLASSQSVSQSVSQGADDDGPPTSQGGTMRVLYMAGCRCMLALLGSQWSNRSLLLAGRRLRPGCV
jgi:hypothetical protein